MKVFGDRKRAREAEPPATAPAQTPSTSWQQELAALPDPADRSTLSHRRLLAVGSGKGGVGKTLISSSLAVTLTEASSAPVIAIDVDLGGANLHTCLGIARPDFALNRFVLDQAPLESLTTPSGVAGLSFIGGASDIVGLAEFGEQERRRFMAELADLGEGTIVLDLGAGSSLFNLDLFCLADQAVLVTTTEPTAVQNAYGFLRAAVYRKLRLLFDGEEALREMVATAMNHQDEELDSIPRLIERIGRYNGWAASQLRSILEEMRVGLVVNMSAAAPARRVAERLSAVARRYLGTNLNFLGSVELDETVRLSIHESRPLLVHYPKARAARSLRALATRLTGRLEPGLPVQASAAG